jgi:prepilin-type N-terminal cleavage/methylation domain-containing protein
MDQSSIHRDLMRSTRRILCQSRRPAPHGWLVAQRPRAFTMIELVVVILIMSIFAAASAPAFMDSLIFHRVETAARRVKADIDYTRQRARLTSTAQSITFTAAGTYTISGAKSLQKSTLAYAVDLKKAPYSLDSATANFSNTLVLKFDGYGTPLDGNGAPLTVGTVVLKSKSHQCTISVNSVTGVVTFSSNHTTGGTSQVAGG